MVKSLQHYHPLSLYLSKHTMEDTPNAQLGYEVNTTPALVPNEAPIHGSHVTLERLNLADHLDDLYSTIGGPSHSHLWTWLKTGPFTCKPSLQACLERYLTEDATRAFYAVVVDGTQRAVGIIALCDIDQPNRGVEIGPVVYGEVLQRTRAATEVVYLLLCHVFEVLGFRRVRWGCNSLNVASGRAAERYGFVYEGLLRQNEIVKGRNSDSMIYGMVDGEWEVAKRGFEAWLAKENFDGEGRQRKSLMKARKSLM